jgi:hypothetical protein
MALYKNASFLTQSTNAAFDSLLAPGTIAANSGIYRCAACGDEVAANKGNPLPPQNHHQHAPGVGPIQWQLIVYPVQK